MLLTVKEHFKKPRTTEDRFDVIGKTVSMKLRDVPKHQMLIAENLINDTLFQAEMGNLTLTHKVNDEATQHSYFSPETIVMTSSGTTSPIPGELNVQYWQYYELQPSSNNVVQANTISNFFKNYN